jgi:hypothetical protein
MLRDIDAKFFQDFHSVRARRLAWISADTRRQDSQIRTFRDHPFKKAFCHRTPAYIPGTNKQYGLLTVQGPPNCHADRRSSRSSGVRGVQGGGGVRSQKLMGAG